MSELNREIVKTNYGMIKGIVKDGYTEFLGIPYAKPPVGELRWKAPERMDKWEGVLETNHFPNRCMQMEQNDFYFKEFYEDSKYETDMSEDCLYLNIWMPNMEREGMCPVAFFIHGGAFFNGSIL
jgi:para-nitrobenzyl esterase